MLKVLPSSGGGLAISGCNMFHVMYGEILDDMVVLTVGLGLGLARPRSDSTLMSVSLTLSLGAAVVSGLSAWF